MKLSSSWPKSKSPRGWLFSNGMSTIGLWELESGCAAASRRSPAVSQSVLKDGMTSFAGTSSAAVVTSGIGTSSGLLGSEIALPWRRSDLKKVLIVVPRSNACWSNPFLLFILLAALMRELR